MNYCFDTSAINRVNEDADRESILSALQDQVLITAVNAVEIFATKDVDKRSALIVSMGRLAKGGRPLAFPDQFLRLLAVAHHRGLGRQSLDLDYVTIPTLRDLGHLGENDMNSWSSWKREQEDGFGLMFDSKTRSAFSRLFEKRSTMRPPSFAALIREHYGKQEFIYEYLGPLYERATGARLGAEQLIAFLKYAPEYSTFLLALAHGCYSRCIMESHYGGKGKPGYIDLSFAVYLSQCDYFVTADEGQYGALRLVNMANPRRTRILRYRELKRRLFVN